MKVPISDAIYLIAKKWSGKVKTRKMKQKGVFTKGGPEIASHLLSIANDPQEAMQKLNFYINRGGSNISGDQMESLEKAKEIISKKIDTSKKK